jgi:hypothetical protein
MRSRLVDCRKEALTASLNTSYPSAAPYPKGCVTANGKPYPLKLILSLLHATVPACGWLDGGRFLGAHWRRVIFHDLLVLSVAVFWRPPEV